MLELRLTTLNGRQPQTFALRPPEVVFGRGRDCDFRIRARDVSRRHCRIVFYPTYVAIEDLSSTNGTFVNGQRISASQALKRGDIIRIGSAVFRVDFIGPGEATSAPAGPVAVDTPMAESVEDEPASVFVKLNNLPPDQIPDVKR